MMLPDKVFVLGKQDNEIIAICNGLNALGEVIFSISRNQPDSDWCSFWIKEKEITY